MSGSVTTSLPTTVVGSYPRPAWLIELDYPGRRASRTGRPDIVPRVVGPIRRLQPGEVADVRLLRANTLSPVEHLIGAPDCGMKCLPRLAAFDKLQVVTRAARAVRTGLPMRPWQPFLNSPGGSTVV